MKYSVGQKVKIRSLEWYRDNVNRYGIIECGKYEFFEPMNEYCGKVVTIKRIDDDNYRIDADKGAFCWTDEMIEGLAEESVLSAPNITEGVFIPEKEMKWTTEYVLPDGYIFKDEHGNVINATKIVLEKKKKEYPKTYKECCEILDVPTVLGFTDMTDGEVDLYGAFISLKRCRDAYWKIAGDEMGLGKPWEPCDTKDKYIIRRAGDEILKGYNISCVLEFPTPEMRDAFKENFDPDIEFCKELL